VSLPDFPAADAAIGSSHSKRQRSYGIVATLLYFRPNNPLPYYSIAVFSASMPTMITQCKMSDLSSREKVEIQSVFNFPNFLLFEFVCNLFFAI